MTAGAWAILDAADGVPERLDPDQSFPGALAVAPDRTVWLTMQGEPTRGFDCGGLVAFDGTTWTPYLRNTCIYALDIGPDGSVWAITFGGLHRIRR